MVHIQFRFEMLITNEILTVGEQKQINVPLYKGTNQSVVTKIYCNSELWELNTMGTTMRLMNKRKIACNELDNDLPHVFILTDYVTYFY